MDRVILLLPILSGVMFGSVGVFVRILSAHGLDNVTILFLRAAFAALELCAVLLVTDRRLFRIRLRDLPLFLGTGIVGMLGLNLCYNEALNHLSLSLAAVLLCMAPAFVLIFAALFLKEPVTRGKLLCLLLAIAGCVLSSGALEQGAGAPLSGVGVCAGAASAVFYALYSIFSRKATDRGFHTYTVIFYSVLLLTAALLPFADYGAIAGFAARDPVPSLALLAFHALCASVLPNALLTLALMRADAGRVSTLASGGEPVAAVIFGWIFFAEVPTPLMLLGFAVTISALVLLCRTPPAKARTGP